MPKLSNQVLTNLRLEPGQKDRIVFDSETPGLGVRLTAAGTRTFIVQWTDPATKRKVREPLGRWGSLTVEQARSAARARLGDVAKGVDVRAQRKAAAVADEQRREDEALTLEALMGQWDKLHLSTRSATHRGEAMRALRFAFGKHLSRPATKLTRPIVIAALDALTEAGRTTMAARTMAYGRSLYGWAEKRGRVRANPFERLPISASNTERDRVLTDEELRMIWRAADGMGYPFGSCVRLAILTLQRRDEVAGMAWSEIDRGNRLWRIPATKMKNNRAHDVHLSAPALAILENIPRFHAQDLVFSTTGRSPISGFSRAKINLDARIAGEQGRALDPWRFHDFRRTGVTKLAALGFDSIVVDRLLAHQPSRLRGVASVYQRHGFLEERARALDVWAAHVTQELSDNVVPLRAPA